MVPCLIFAKDYKLQLTQEGLNFQTFSFNTVTWPNEFYNLIEVEVSITFTILKCYVLENIRHQ